MMSVTAAKALDDIQITYTVGAGPPDGRLRFAISSLI